MELGGAIELDGETGTELTCMMSSWKSAGPFVTFALSTLSTVGSGVGGFSRGLRFGLVCL
jgi:hypothetical protein